MKILHVIHFFLPDSLGGTEIYAYNLARRLSREHKQLFFFCKPVFSLKQIFSRRLIENNTFDNLEFISVQRPSLFFFTAFEEKLLVERTFKRILKQFNPDLVHYHHLISLSLKLPLISHHQGIPSVFTLHDSSLICPRYRLIDDKLEICSRQIMTKCILCCLKAEYKEKKYSANNLVENLRNKIDYLGYNIYFRIKNILFLLFAKHKIKKIFEDVDLFISPSLFLKDLFIKNGLEPNKIVHIIFGLDKSLFKEIKKIYSPQLRFGFMGNISDQKGIKILIQAFNEIKNASLKIYGKEDVEGKIKSMRKIVKNKKIEFRGAVYGEEKKAAFRDMDVLVFPSLLLENAPLVIQEAFMARVPVITSNLGGMLELVKDKINGLYFKTGDVDDLRAKLEFLINNPQEVRRMSENIKEIKNLAEHVKEIEDIYRQIIKKDSRIAGLS